MGQERLRKRVHSPRCSPATRATRSPQGSVTYRRQGPAELEPEERAWEGIFLAFQYPVEIPGVATTYFLRTALNAMRKQPAAKPEMDAAEFLMLVRAKAATCSSSLDEKLMTARGQRRLLGRREEAQRDASRWRMMEPRLAILDETDSGLDIDALKTVADGVNALRAPDRAMLVITHYQRLLDYIVPDHVHVLAGGRIVRSGNKGLALELEQKGYAAITSAAA